GARSALGDRSMSIGELTREMGLGDWFRTYYLAPFSGAIWSTPTTKILDFPAEALLRFFENHALMGYTGQHQWYTVRGGSEVYVSRLSACLDASGVDIRRRARVAGVRRISAGVEVRAEGGAWEMFDDVIFATHSDDTLSMLEDPTPFEKTRLGAIRYQPNQAILHADPAMMPKRRQCWSSWVYTEGSDGAGDRIGLTYWMNSLQPIPMDDPMFVTLNPTRTIREDLVYDEATFSHPVYDAAALSAQAEIRAMNGAQNTWFCGAWMRDGFHEDGLASAIDVANALTAAQNGAIAAE
ncbi:MAG: FAD-dependent oxidoreductase, partial [Pseudomonadota bacterium]